MGAQFLDSLMEKAKAEKIYDLKDAPQWIKEHPHQPVSPFWFGCPDFEHNDKGELDDWSHLFKPPLSPEEKVNIHPQPRSEQVYDYDTDEDALYGSTAECDAVYGSNMVDKGIQNDYWRARGLYYSYTKHGAL